MSNLVQFKPESGSPDAMTDDELDKMFIRLITEHQSELLGYIRSLMPRFNGAQDVLQEVNIAIWNQRTKLREMEAFKGWAYKIAYFRTCTHIKKVKSREQPGLEPEVLDKIAAEYEFRSDDTILDDALSHCLQKLSPEDHQLVTMHYEKHGGLKEYASEIGTSIGRLKHALIRIRSNLKICIERQVEAN